eukprot:364924-Chlamydomonas_euryale.AAC.6
MLQTIDNTGPTIKETCPRYHFATQRTFCKAGGLGLLLAVRHQPLTLADLLGGSFYARNTPAYIQRSPACTSIPCRDSKEVCRYAPPGARMT